MAQPPFDLWPLGLVGMAGVLWAVAQAPTRNAAAWATWFSGLGYFGASLTWIVEPFLVDAATTGILAPFGLFGLSGGLALIWALCVALIWAARWPLVSVTVALAMAELLRGFLFTGFPWGQVGYVLAPTPVVQIAAWVGPYGLSAVTLALALGLAQGVARPWVGVVMLVAFAALWGAGAARVAPVAEGDKTVRLVQPNAPQHQKWDPAHIPTFFQRQIDATAAPGAPDLIVWPETAVPTLLDHSEQALSVISDAAGGPPVMVGVQRRVGETYRNSAALLDPDGQVAAVYDKHHLVPFGEYMPFPNLFARINIGGLAARAQGGFAPGPGPQVLRTSLGQALILICYEAVFPRNIRTAAARPDVLLHLTNDAWFGTRAGPQQHLMQARLRSIESGVPLVRAANTGISAAIDPYGRIVAQLGLGEAGHLDVAVPAALPPTLYARIGDLPLAVLLGIVAVVLRFAPLARGGR